MNGARRAAALATLAAGGWVGSAVAAEVAGATGARMACPAPGAAQVTWQAQPAPWRVGQPVVLRVRLCPAGATLRAFDATMPEHRHGMNYQPQVQALGDGLWQVQGVLLHMAGRWELRFDADVNGRLETLRETLVLR